METKKVKDLMIPREEYAMVRMDATLYDAIVALEESQKNVKENLHPHRAVLVVDRYDRIVGKLGHLGFLKALEPKVQQVGDYDRLTRAGVSSEFASSIMEQLRLMRDNIRDICVQARNVRVREVMHPITEHIDEDASLVEAIHKIVMWQTLSLLVTRGDRIVGILRLSDLYEEVARYIRSACIEDDET
jgi:predicted transcriptional regulator